MNDKPPTKQERQGKSDKKDNPANAKEGDGSKGISRVSKALVYIVFFGLLGSWGGLIGNLGHGFWIYADVILLIASVFAAFHLRLELRNHHWFKWQYNLIFWGVIGLSFLLGIPPAIMQMNGKPLEKPKPHFRLKLLTTDETGTRSLPLDLEPALSKRKPRTGGTIVKATRNAVLAIPIRPNTTNVDLMFILDNDSSEAGSFSHCTWYFQSKTRMRPPDRVPFGWYGVAVDGIVVDGKLESAWTDAFACNGGYSIPAHFGEAIPPLTFQSVSEGSCGMAEVQVRGTNFDDIDYLFFLAFVADTNMTAYTTYVDADLRGDRYGIWVPSIKRP